MRLTVAGQGILRGFAICCAALVLVACVSAGAKRPLKRDPYLISAAELAESSVSNLYDAVRQLRPGWLRPTGRTAGTQGVAVYLDEQLLGGGAALRRFSTHSVQELRYLRPTEAQVRYGPNNMGRAAIVLLTAVP